MLPVFIANRITGCWRGSVWKIAFKPFIYIEEINLFVPELNWQMPVVDLADLHLLWRGE